MNRETITNRADALASGAPHYFTGRPCKHGHIANRITQNGSCIVCARNTVDRYQAENRDLLRARRALNYAENAEKLREKSRKYRAANPDKVKAHNDRYIQANKAKRASIQMRRKAAKLQRTPQWLTRDQFAEIDSLYEEARRLTLEKGIQYHVDHIMPLQGRLVCGLHVPWNLQVMLAKDNMKKHNRLPDSDHAAAEAS